MVHSPNPVFSSKRDARAWALRMRSAITQTEIAAISRAMAARILKSPKYSRTPEVLVYIGAKAGELDTRPIVASALRDGKSVLIPVTQSGGKLAWSRLESLDELARSRRGLLEPREGAMRPRQPEGGLCIVPGACFRRDGHRIGFGAGYYDRFLASFAGDSLAMTPEAFFRVEFPVEPHDQAVDVIVTEAGWYDVNRTTAE